MRIREAREQDRPRIRHLAESLELNYPEMENDRFWGADEGGLITGIVGLKRRPDCFELVALGVDPASRQWGVGRKLVQALLEAAPSAVYLATVIPHYFERLGFVRTPLAPTGMAKEPAWCEGCDTDRCAVMVRTTR